MDKKQEKQAVYILIEKYRNSEKPIDYLTIIEDYNLICKEIEEKFVYIDNSKSKK